MEGTETLNRQQQKWCDVCSNFWSLSMFHTNVHHSFFVCSKTVSFIVARFLWACVNVRFSYPCHISRSCLISHEQRLLHNYCFVKGAFFAVLYFFFAMNWLKLPLVKIKWSKQVPFLCFKRKQRITQFMLWITKNYPIKMECNWNHR